MMSTPPRLFGIEAARSIAAISVVLYHVARHLDKAFGAPILKQIFQFGHAGVDFFFVISGFIILFVHYRDIDDPRRIGHYFGRRFTRLMPIYWIALVITLFMGLHGTSWDVFLVSFFLLPVDRPMILGVAWTLQFEVVFYALFAVLILNRVAGLLVFAAWLSLIILGCFVSLAGLSGQIYASVDLEFFFGMTIAVILTHHRIRWPFFWLMLGLASFVASAIAEDLGWIDGYATYARLLYGVPSMLIILGLVEADRRGVLHTPVILQRLGSASYSIYLFQFVFIGTVWQILSRTNLPVILDFLILSSVAIIGSVAISSRIELPLMKWVRNLSGAHLTLKNRQI